MGNLLEKSTMNMVGGWPSEEAWRNVDLTVPSVVARRLLQLPASTQDGRRILKVERMRSGINMDSGHAQEY